MLSLDWDFRAHVSDVVEETFRIAYQRNEVATIVADLTTQNIEVHYHIDVESAEAHCKPIATKANVIHYYANREARRDNVA